MSTIDIIALAADFDRDGFVLVPGLLDAVDLAALAQGVDWALETLPGQPWIKPRSYEWHDSHPIFVKLIEHPVVLGLAATWFGHDFHLIAAQCSRNTRDDFYSPGAIPWHHDYVFFPEPGNKSSGVADDHYGFSAMWYIQDTPLEMGPTQLLPGSQHNMSMIDDEATVDALVFTQPIQAGTLLIFNHRTWHRGRPNTTPIPRDLVTNAYARPEVSKAQLLTPQPGGGEVYVEPQNLLTRNTVLAMLLRQRDGHSSK